MTNVSRETIYIIQFYIIPINWGARQFLFWEGEGEKLLVGVLVYIPPSKFLKFSKTTPINPLKSLTILYLSLGEGSVIGVFYDFS